MRMIDADALPNELFKRHVHDGEELEPMMYFEDAVKVVEDAPTIDAIPVALYKAEIETLRSRCYPGAEDAFRRKAYGCLKIVPVSYGTKSVDAIPVEWLMKVLAEANEFPISERETIVAIPYLVKRWQKEQEAR